MESFICVVCEICSVQRIGERSSLALLGRYCFKKMDKLSSVPELRKLGVFLGLWFCFLKPIKTNPQTKWLF